MAIKRINRSVSLEESLSFRLKYLAKRMGSNPNSYIVNAIGRAIASDERLFGIEPDQYLIDEHHHVNDENEDLS